MTQQFNKASPRSILRQTQLNTISNISSLKALNRIEIEKPMRINKHILPLSHRHHRGHTLVNLSTLNSADGDSVGHSTERKDRPKYMKQGNLFKVVQKELYSLSNVTAVGQSTNRLYCRKQNQLKPLTEDAGIKSSFLPGLAKFNNSINN